MDGITPRIPVPSGCATRTLQQKPVQCGVLRELVRVHLPEQGHLHDRGACVTHDAFHVSFVGVHVLSRGRVRGIEHELELELEHSRHAIRETGQGRHPFRLKSHTSYYLRGRGRGEADEERRAGARVVADGLAFVEMRTGARARARAGVDGVDGEDGLADGAIRARARLGAGAGAGERARAGAERIDLDLDVVNDLGRPFSFQKRWRSF